MPSQECIFDNMALYFECQIQINKKRTPSDYFFGDFTHWLDSYFLLYRWVEFTKVLTMTAKQAM